MQFEVTILGSNGAVPAFERYPSAQILNFNGHQFLIDCGEGTQFRMNKFNIKRGKLDHIFITHLHGDHFYGLIGLLTSFNLNGREHPLHLYAPVGMEEIMNVQLKHSKTRFAFEVHFHPITDDRPRIIFDEPLLSVETIPLKHRIPTTGFLFREKMGLRKIIPERIEQYKIPFPQIAQIKAGSDFTTADGKIIPNSQLTLPPSQPRSYAYCTDTAYTETIVPLIKGVDLLYHETTFIEEHKQRAGETFHSTTKQAARIAQLAGVKKMLIGHFSARYENLQPLLDECREIFKETYLAEEGKTFLI